MAQYRRGLKPTWRSPSTFTWIPGVTLGLPGGQACMTSTFTQGPPSWPVSLAGNQYLTLRPSLPKTHCQSYKAMEEKDPLFKKSPLWSYWLNMEWLFSSEDSKILFSSNIDLTVYFDKWLRKINEALTINTNVYVYLYILRGCPMISYASDLNYNKFSQ